MEKFHEMKQHLLSAPHKRRLGVVVAQDEHTLEAVAEAAKDGLIDPVLYGQRALITPIWEKVAGEVPEPDIVECSSTEACIGGALDAVHAGRLDCIMKGKLETGTLMKAVVNHRTGIRRSDALSLVALMESPYYHKIFAITDVGLMTYPTLEQKKAIISNAVDVLHGLGVACPKVGVLAAVEKVNPNMPESVEADALKQMNQKGELSGCIVEGPISYDLCMDPAAAAIKGYDSPVAGDPDILVVPDIVAGNILAKSLICTGGAKTCGTVVGALVPIILTSRSAAADDKYMSIVLSALIGCQ